MVAQKEIAAYGAVPSHALPPLGRSPPPNPMKAYLGFTRAASSVAVLVVSAMMPQTLEACINKYNPITGIQTITCCGDTKCCTTTWHGSELIELVCDP